MVLVSTDDEVGAMVLVSTDDEVGAMVLVSTDEAAEDIADMALLAADDIAESAEDIAEEAAEETAEVTALDVVVVVGVVLPPRLKIQIRPMITITATMMIIQVLRFMEKALGLRSVDWEG
jgi:hypothetical protein